MSMNPTDDTRSAQGARLATDQRPPEGPRPANPQARFNFLLLLAVASLIGVLPAAGLLYSGYLASPGDACNTIFLFPGQVCDYTSLSGTSISAAQALSMEQWAQWIDRLIGVVWALLTIRYTVRAIRMQAVQNAPGRPIANDFSWLRPADQATYTRNRIVSFLSRAGIVICVVGVMLLLLLNPRIL